jgi:hypothetical protein
MLQSPLVQVVLPLVYAALWLAAIVNRGWQHRFRFSSRQPVTISGWAVLLAMYALGSLGALLSWQGLQGRQPTEIRIVDIPLPMSPAST